MNWSEVFAVLFWLASGCFIFHYGGLLLIHLFISPSTNNDNPIPEIIDEELPTLTVIVSAYNEESTIAHLVRSILEANYPPDKLKLLVISDASTDSTAQIARQMADQRVEVIESSPRMGKFAILDRFIPNITSEVTLISDADVVFDPQALRLLAHHYTKPEVGGVGGRHQVKPSNPRDVLRHEKRYLDLEISLKRLTSRWGFVVGAYGCINSLRTRLYRPLGKRPLHDDVIIPLSITAQGYKFLFEERAKTWESVPLDLYAEFKRRKRMSALNLSTLFPMVKLSYFSGVKVLMVTIFYKVFRWASPFFILGMLLGSLGGSIDFLFFRRVAGVLWGSLLLSLLGGSLLRWRIQLPILSPLYYFALMNWAQLTGFFLGLKGAPATWEPRS